VNYEVEQKFPVGDLAAVERRLSGMGVGVSEPRGEADLYFAHPARDFSATDEALRIRRVGQSNSITYKGPKVDAATKTRRELELPLAPDDASAAAWGELLEVLGFRPVAEVRKRRRKATVPWQGRRVEASLDEVDEVGTFVELELVTTPDNLEAAKACIASLADSLGLSGSQRRSYLELLLERRAAGRRR
jgi:adenylate cyclase class 2